MSKKFFYNKVYNPKKRNTIIGVSISAGVLVVGTVGILIYNQSNKVFTCDNQIIKPKEQMNIEINSKFPNAKSYFNEVQCVNERKIQVDNSNVDITKLGEYTAYTSIADNTYEIKVNVVDNTAPDLKLKDVSINLGESCTYEDFVESCVDNSKEPCKIDFYKGESDENGTDIIYSEFKDAGNYEVKLIATDSSGNQSIVSGSLYIADEVGEPTTEPDPEPTPSPEPEPVKCEYGNLEYDSSSYTLTVMVGFDNCAISPDEIQKDSVKDKIVKIADTETEKIQNQINQISGLSGTLTVTRNITGIPNKTGTGYVGYELSIKITDDNSKVIVDYKLNSDNSRNYTSNLYNIK